jgi:chorismate mutase/prephenate dehydratase
VKEDNNIPSLRRKIDQIDGEIIHLLGQRGRCAMEIGDLKRSQHLPVLDVGRERELLESLFKRNSGPLPDSALRHIFSEIISACRGLQAPTRVAYLGPEATFSHLAAQEYYGKSCIFLSQDTIPDVFRAVENGQADFGVVPVENSNEGAVGQTLDRLAVSEVKVCGEILRRISHVLISHEAGLKGVTSVFSHPQALAQCFGWLSKNLPGRDMTPTSSTASAAQKAQNVAGSAAIGSEMLAEVHGLKILARDIQDRSQNLTRFLLLGKEACSRTGRDKTSIAFTTRHIPGVLRQALTPFADKGINITKIESRPLKETPWEYIFFLDFEGHSSDDHVREALEDLSGCTQRLLVLGSYPLGESAEQRSWACTMHEGKAPNRGMGDRSDETKQAEKEGDRETSHVRVFPVAGIGR